MKVLITNVTGSQKNHAVLHVSSGVIELEGGEISHIIFEKHMNKTIVEYKEPRPEPVKEEVKESSSEQSKEPKKKKIK